MRGIWAGGTLTVESKAKRRICWIITSLPLSLLERLREVGSDAQSIVTAAVVRLVFNCGPQYYYSRMTDESLHRRRQELQGHSIMNELLRGNLIENQSLRTQAHDSLWLSSA
jgi:hypothetical protein